MKSYFITIASAITRRTDAIGVALSALCGVHCVAMPALAASGLLLGGGEGGDYTHYALFGTAAPVTLLAMWRVVRHGHGSWMLAVGAAGIVLLWLGLSHDGHDVRATLTTLAGAVLLAGFHLCHWRLHRHGKAHGHSAAPHHTH